MQAQFGPQHVQDLVISVEEVENFRFGNGGMAPSSKRWRIPAVICEQILLIWVSVVPINSLGCLLGRDFLDAVGGILSFADRTLECSFLGTPPQRLDQMQAGHFILPLQPERWPRLDGSRWRKVGLDGIIELQLKPHAWLKRRLHEGTVGHAVLSHDHMLAESSLLAGCIAPVPAHHEAHCVDVCGLAHSTMRSFASGEFPPQHPLRPGGLQDPFQADGAAAKSLNVAEVASLRAAPLGSTAMARPRTGSVAVRAFFLALLAFSISINCLCGSMAATSSVDGESSHSDFQPLAGRNSSWSLYSDESDRDEQIQRSMRLEAGVSGGLTPFWFLGHQSQQGPKGQLESPGICRSQGTSPESCGQRTARRSSTSIDWTPWWTSSLLQVDVDARDTVPVLQKKLRPMVEILKYKDTKASSSKESSVTTAKEFQTPPMPKRAAAVTAESTRSSPSTQSVTLDQVDVRIQDLLAQQEQRFQTMLLPVLQHVVNMQGNMSTPPPVVPGSRNPGSDDEMSPQLVELIGEEENNS